MRVEELIDLGVRFDRSDDDPERYSLHREGGHSARRILHSKDLTGAEVMRATDTGFRDSWAGLTWVNGGGAMTLRAVSVSGMR